MKIGVVLLLLALATPAYAWRPPSGGPSKMAKRVLDSLPEPNSVRIPSDIEQRSRTTSPSPQVPLEGVKDAVPSTIGGCWQVQITALSDADRARDLAAQEALRLGVPARVVAENGLAKIRAGEDCMSYDDATKLRDRVRETGYPGAFVIRQSGGSGS